MKTECYCIYCPKHPLHSRRKKLDAVTGFVVGDILIGNTGRKVDCLEPVSAAFDAFDIVPAAEKFPVTAYGDGQAITGFSRDMGTFTAWCGNEAYSD